MSLDGLSPEQLELLGLLMQDDAPAVGGIPRVGDGPAPLSYAQRQLFLFERFYPGSPAYGVSLGMRLRGPLQAAAMQVALQGLVQRYSALRTRFWMEGEEPLQQVLPAWRFALPTVELAHLPEAERERTLWQVVQEELGRGWDLAQGQLLRGLLFVLGPQEHVLLLLSHHIITDAMSMGMMARDLLPLLDAVQRGLTDPLPAPLLQMIDVAAWERAHRQARPEDVDWWKAQLSEAPLLSLPTDRPRPARPTFAGARLRIELPRPVAEALRALAQQAGTTLYVPVLAGFQAVLSRWAGHEDVVVGTPIAARGRPELEQVFGFLVNVLALRTQIDPEAPFRALVEATRATVTGAFAHQELPFELLVDELRIKRDASMNPIFQVSFALFRFPELPSPIPGLEVSPLHLPSASSKFDLTLDLWDQPGGPIFGFLEYSTDLWDTATIERLGQHIVHLLSAAAAQPDTPVHRLPLLGPDERQRVLVAWNATAGPFPGGTLHAAVAARAHLTRPAVIGEDRRLDHAQLWAEVEGLAGRLAAAGVRRGDRVGICMRRGASLPVALLGAMRAGAAYVPLDPDFPRARLQDMAEDAGIAALISDGSHEGLLEGLSCPLLSPQGPALPPPPDLAGPDDLAYILYTSGSTGRPRGVPISHANVLSFFGGMDERIGGGPGTWLALTSISFDISVLELLWTLSRGWTVVVQPGLLESSGPEPASGLRFGLFYFAAEGGGGPAAYRLLLEGGQLADQLGLEAIWMPERHLDRFGGIYPNPAVTAAALAATTRRISLRAGSAVLPLHHPLRLAEDWAVVDCISGGRVQLALASGWHANDFVFAPERYAERKRHLTEGAQTLRRLWRGEPVSFAGGAGPVEARLHPRPVQPELPIWITAAGNPDTFRAAGEAGHFLLTHLLGQGVEGLAEKIQHYRSAWQAAGHPGQGRVALMLHTLLCEDDEEALELAREPFLAYLRQSLDLAGQVISRLAPDSALASLSAEEREQMVRHGYRRFVHESGLFGRPQTVLPLLRRLAAAGVDEIGALIDFGVPEEAALRGIRLLADLQQQLAQGDHRSIAAQLHRHGVTHMQCTPSLLRLVPPEALAQLQLLMLGGEALPPALLEQLPPGLRVENMYGPTETTIWSTTGAVRPGEPVTLGRPIRNTRCYVVDRWGQPQPIGVPGELWIGGPGVARGYWRRPEDSAARFIDDPFLPGGRIYRSGDRVRWLPDGRLQYLGRMDHQIKIRGHRVEPAEVEAALSRLPGVAAAVAHPLLQGGELRLCAWVVPSEEDPQAEAQHVEDWGQIWDRNWAEGESEDPRFDIRGWRSAVTGQPIPPEQMREWVEATARRLLELRPQRVLELGCGTGLMVHRIAPHVQRYRATDRSPVAVERLRLHAPPGVELAVESAEEPHGEGFDAVLISSVIQYLPGPAHLRRVLESAVRATRPGGVVMVADVRDLRHQRRQAEATATAAGLEGEAWSREVERRCRDEEELMVEPGWFQRASLPGVGAVQLLRRRGWATNEMSAWRYDVLLRVGPPQPPARATLLRWTGRPELERELSGRPERLRCADLPDGHNLPGLPMEELISWGEARGYRVELAPAASGEAARVDALLHRADLPWAPIQPPLPGQRSTHPLALRARSQRLGPWMAALREQLPDFMVPTDLVLLGELPLTPNGKVDRKALPPPDRQAQHHRRGARPPQTASERRLAPAFAAALGLEEIDVEADFFDSGGHSLLAVHLLSRIQAEAGLSIPIVVFFENSSVARLAAWIDAQLEAP